jgi:hypothetical protein
MAQRPEEHAQDYGLSRDVAADIEEDEGPPSQGQHGETRTNLAGHADRQGHGPKTRQKTKDVINRQDRGGAH